MKTKVFVLALVFAMPNLRLVRLLNTLQIRSFFVCFGFPPPGHLWKKEMDECKVSGEG